MKIKMRKKMKQKLSALSSTLTKWLVLASCDLW